MTQHAITFICSEILSSATLGKYISFYEDNVALAKGIDR